jgi:hypothetical protein
MRARERCVSTAPGLRRRVWSPISEKKLNAKLLQGPPLGVVNDSPKKPVVGGKFADRFETITPPGEAEQTTHPIVMTSMILRNTFCLIE